MSFICEVNYTIYDCTRIKIDKCSDSIVVVCDCEVDCIVILSVLC